jgi:hypothetical protein
MFQVFNIQDTGGTTKTVAKGIALIEAMLPKANAVKREPCSAAHITVGLQCGGSDGYSGISANPALGAAVDLLVAHGGTAILSETPEIYGAEHLLTRRAVNSAIAEKLISRIKWWENYTAINNGEMNNNPSPGNKAGGLTTILEKSLGAVAKGGTSGAANIPAYHVAGKSGTTWLYVTNRGYDNHNFIAHFAGFAPVENPRVVLVVSIKQPDTSGGQHVGGGTMSAPVFAQIAAGAMRILDVAPEVPGKIMHTPVETAPRPPVVEEPEAEETAPLLDDLDIGSGNGVPRR